MMELLRRPEITYEKLQQAFDLEPLSPVAAEEVDVEVKYKAISISRNRKSCGP